MNSLTTHNKAKSLTLNELYFYVLSQVKQRIHWLAHNQCITLCQDDKNECTQIMHIKVYDLVSRYLNGELPFSNDRESLVYYTKQALKNSAIDYNRRLYERSRPANFPHFHSANEEVDLNEIAIFPNGERQISIQKTVDHLIDEMQKIAPQTMHIIACKVIAQKSTAEIAEELNMTCAQINQKSRQGLIDMKELASLMNLNLEDILNDS